MKKALLRTALFLLIGGLAFSCNNDNNDTADSNVTKKQVIENYAEIGYTN